MVILNTIKQIIILLIVNIALPIYAKVSEPITIQQANHLAAIIHKNHQTTFYCGCTYSNKAVDLKSCGYLVQKSKKRATQLEWEHIVPASMLGKDLSCWQNPICCNDKSCYKGRACCQKIDPDFLKMATDLHNIVPAIGELNGIRSNYSFAELPQIKSHQFGYCYYKVDRKNKKVEPRAKVKGTIARTYLYMVERYKITLTPQEQKLFLKWNKKYPPNSWEIEWNKQVRNIQHNDNHYISKYNKQ